MDKQQHTIEWLKRQAKSLKKEKGIPHHEALDTIAKNMGYDSWTHLLTVYPKTDRSL